DMGHEDRSFRRSSGPAHKTSFALTYQGARAALNEERATYWTLAVHGAHRVSTHACSTRSARHGAGLALPPNDAGSTHARSTTSTRPARPSDRRGPLRVSTHARSTRSARPLPASGMTSRPWGGARDGGAK